MGELSYWGLFAMSFLAATLIPFSSEGLLAAMLIGDFNPTYCIVMASVGNWLGGITSYYLGYLANWKSLEKWFKVSRKKVERFKNRVDQMGPFLALFCWLPIVGDLLAVALGVFRVRALPVIVFMLIGKTARYLVVFWIISKMM